MDILNYTNFLDRKTHVDSPSGFECSNGLIPEKLFDFQRAIVKWALKRGRAAVFADTGMGKTMIQLAWAEAVSQYHGNRVLIVTPLCVSQQTVKESEKLDMSLVRYIRKMPENGETGIFVTNYEMLENFDFNTGYFEGIVLDESSILKHQNSKTRSKIIEMTREVPYKLSCTATPSPNDHMELASQAEFLGIMDSMEMLATFFTHDSGETSKWRLKGHGRSKFWEWLASWSVYIKKPSDIGFSDDGYHLPKLEIKHHLIKTDFDVSDYKSKKGLTLSGRNKARRDTIDLRVEKCIDLVNKAKGPFLVWCNLNDESQKLTIGIHGAVEVKGSDKISIKETNINHFTNGDIDVLVTKPKIAGFGMNWQHCNQMAFVGLNDSYEQLYQAIRRCWRFGQTKPVTAHLFYSDIEGDVFENLKSKEYKAQEMQNELIVHMKDFQTREVNELRREISEYTPKKRQGPNFTICLDDCVVHSQNLKEDSIDYCIFSPPFSSLYTYSNSERDMGNSKNDDEFWDHFNYLIPNLFKALRPGRNLSVHCMNLPTSKVRHGYIGLRDFRGEIIRAFQNSGFIYCSEVTVWKNPVVAMQRTKALGLLWKQIKKDSSMNRQGLPDYVVTFRKPGVNDKPISHTADDFTVDEWQHLASPCWMDIQQSNTLNRKLARAEKDERHIAPLQLNLIERCLRLWSRPGDLVYSPFTGIGSEGYVALEMGRHFIGTELKESYFNCAIDNLMDAESRFSSIPRGRFALKFDEQNKDISFEIKKPEIDPDDKNQTKFDLKV